MPRKAKRTARRGTTGRKPKRKLRKTARKSKADSAPARGAAGKQRPDTQRAVAAPDPSLALFAAQGGWPDPLTLRRHSLQCLGLSA